jgi:hypothetical protein
MKCHECGDWDRNLNTHIKSHGMRRVDYNKKHGLRRKTSLWPVKARKIHRDLAAKQCKTSGSPSLRRKQPMPSRKGIKLGLRRMESHNDRGRCRAQLVFRIQCVAAVQRHTPTYADLREAGIDPRSVVERFGSVNAAMEIAGLSPNRGPANPTPMNFPSKEEIEKRWNARMEWPEDYFNSGPVQRTSRYD